MSTFNIFTGCELDLNHLSILIDEYNVYPDIDEAIRASQNQGELLSNLFFDTISQINKSFIDALDGILSQTKINKLETELQDLIYINYLDSANQLELAVDWVLKPADLKKLADAGINYKNYIV